MKDFVNKSINANQLNGVSTLTGKLYFSENGILFKAQSVNGTQNKPMVTYNSIEHISARNTLGFIPNGITIHLIDGTRIDYVVSQRKDVIAFLKEKMAKG